MVLITDFSQAPLPFAPLNLDQEGVLFRLLIENARDYAICTLDTQGRYNSWNTGAERLIGYTEAEVLGRHSALIFTAEDREQSVPADEIRRARDTGRAEDDRWHVRKDGTLFWASGVLTPILDQSGEIQGFAKIMRDLTAQREAEETLRANEERYRLAVENVKDYAIYHLDPEGYITTWNQGAERIKGYTEPEVLGQHFRLFYTVEDIQNGKPEWELEVAAREGRCEDEYWRVRKDGQIFWGNEIITALRTDAGKLLGFIKISRDLTQRRQAEEERIAVEREASVLAERHRLAQELHDTLSQAFTSIKLQLEAAEEALEVAPEETKVHLARARDLARQSQVEARRTIRALRLYALETRALQIALAHLAQENVAGAGIDAKFQVEGAIFSLPAPVESELFRIAQEALTNAVRHAGARNVLLELAYSPTTVRLRVRDDGRGFDPTAVTGGGFGLQGIRERAARLGGTLTLESKPGQGTEIAVEVIVARVSGGAEGGQTAEQTNL
jgi:PAS domain S-box-containing protein